MIAFEREPFRRALAAVLQAPADTAPPSLPELADATSVVVVGVAVDWVAVLSFDDAGLRDMRLHEREFAWHGGEGSRVVHLAVDARDGATLAQCLPEMGRDGRASSWVLEPLIVGEHPVLVHMRIIETGGIGRSALAHVELHGEGEAAAGNEPGSTDGSPYRRTAAERLVEVATASPEVEVEGPDGTWRARLAPSPVDDEPASVFAHAVLRAAARAIPALRIARARRRHAVA